MNSGFILALGLAAIDGLTSAFVAMLILALVVVGGDQGTAGRDKDRTFVVTVVKHAPVKLMVRLSASGSARASVYALDQNSFQRVPLEGKTYGGGQILWRDCTVSTMGTCTGQLLINRPRDGQRWLFELAVATTDSELARSLPGPAKVELQVRGGGASSSKLNLCWETLDVRWQKVEFETPTNTLVASEACKT